MKYSNEQLLTFYGQMVLARKFVLHFAEAVKTGKIEGFWHLAEGQEAQIGIWNAIGDKDYISPHFRCHPILINMFDVQKLTNEFLGKNDGYYNGKASVVHMADFEKNLLPLNGILSAQVGIAVGWALSLKMDGSDSVVVVSLGDGSSNEGLFYEAMNLAAIWNLKIVFVIENNGYAISTSISDTTRLEDLYKKGGAVGISGCKCNGNDILEVMDTTKNAINKARKGEPNIVELKTYRYRGHFEGDPMLYRNRKKLDDVKLSNDALKNLEKVLLEKGIATTEDIETINRKKAKIISEAFDHALSLEPAPPEVILNTSMVYAE